MMGGEIFLTSAEGQGTKVTIHLPLAVAASPSAKPDEPSTEAAPMGSVPRLNVLAADDNKTNQMILGLMLGQFGAKVTMVNDGPQALAHFDMRRYDLLVLDISMPEMDGITLLSKIRARETAAALPRTPAIAFTANAMSHQIEAYKAAGFDACLTKPLRKQDLHTMLVGMFGAAQA
jgi:CheY-like chemotaxis protein